MSLQDEVVHQERLLEIHRRYLHHLLIQLSKQGLYSPPSVRIEIQSRRSSIKMLKESLRSSSRILEDLKEDRISEWERDLGVEE